MIPCIANAGVPMLYVVMPAFLAALAPIILIEWACLIWLARSGTGRSLVASVLANSVSTLVGVPVTWVALVAIEFVIAGLAPDGPEFLAFIVMVPWLGPFEEGDQWMVPAAALALNVPFFFISWLCERFVCVRVLRSAEQGGVQRGVLIGNLITYLCLELWWLSRLVAAL